MKRLYRSALLLILITALFLPIAALCEADAAPALRDIILANRTDAILSQHKSFQLRSTPLHESLQAYSLYIDDEYCYTQLSAYQQVYSETLDYERYIY